MNVNFEIAALFPLPFSRVKKGGNFKTNIHLDSVESFLYYLSFNYLLFSPGGASLHNKWYVSSDHNDDDHLNHVNGLNYTQDLRGRDLHGVQGEALVHHPGNPEAQEDHDPDAHRGEPLVEVLPR